MTITPAPSRTIVILSPLFGLSQDYRFPDAQPGDILDYTLDLSSWMADSGDTISSVSLSMSPSDLPNTTPPVEAYPTEVSFSGNLVTGLIASGVPGRSCLTKWLIVTEGGRNAIFLVNLVYSNELSTEYPPTEPGSQDFGTPVHS